MSLSIGGALHVNHQAARTCLSCTRAARVYLRTSITCAFGKAQSCKLCPMALCCLAKKDIKGERLAPAPGFHQSDGVALPTQDPHGAQHASTKTAGKPLFRAAWCTLRSLSEGVGPLGGHLSTTSTFRARLKALQKTSPSIRVISKLSCCES